MPKNTQSIKKKIVVILPTYNEAGNISEIIHQILSVITQLPAYSWKLLVVDDNSPDGTSDIVKKLLKEHLIIHLLLGKKEGLGAAYIKGMNYAIKKLEADILFEIDADLSHDPKLIPLFLKEIESGADFVIGSRYIPGGSIPQNWAWQRKLFSIVGNLIVRYGLMIPQIKEWSSGYRAIKSPVFTKVNKGLEKYAGYTFQIAFLHRTIRGGFRVSEVPLNFIDRKHGASKFEVLDYAPNVIKYVLRESSFIKFFITGLIGFTVDFSIAAFLISLMVFKPTANALSAEVAIMANFFINNYWSFNHKKIRGGAQMYIRKFLHFNAVASGAIVIQWVGIYLLLNFLGDGVLHILQITLPLWVLYKIVIIALFIIPYSFIMYNRFVWNDSTNN